MPEGCTPKNVMGEFVAGLEAQGIKVDSKYIERRLDASGQREYFKTTAQAKSELFDEAPHKEDEKVVSFWTGQFDDKIGKPLRAVKQVAIESRRAEGKFGQENVKPVMDFLQTHTLKYRSNIEAGQKAYYKGIKEVFENIDTSKMSETVLGDFKKYRAFHEGGGRLYKHSDGSVFTTLTSNTAGNTIQASPVVILGNPLEMAMKLPALYPGETIPALLKTIQKGKWFGKVKELDALGVYDTLPDEGGGLIKNAARFLSDNPLKTASYYAGEIKGGRDGGLKAVEKVSFKYRPGNETTWEITESGRAATAFLNYTLNTYRMQAAWYGGLLNKETALASARGLLTYHMIAGVIGGLDAGIPEPIQLGIRLINPETADQIDESHNAATNLVKLGTIDNVFITASMVNRTVQGTWRDLSKSFEKLQDGDVEGAAWDAAEASVLGLAKVTNFMGLGDAQVQKLLKMAKDIWRDEMNGGTVEERLRKDFLYWAK